MFKDYLVYENQRNHDNHKIFQRFLQAALGEQKIEVLVAHHIVYTVLDANGDAVGEPNEIPSADTLLFDPDLMTAVFGEKARAIMMTLCHRTPDLREKVLEDFLNERDLQLRDAAKSA